MRFGKEIPMRVVQDGREWLVFATSEGGIEAIVAKGESLSEAMAAAGQHVAEWAC